MEKSVHDLGFVHGLSKTGPSAKSLDIVERTIIPDENLSEIYLAAFMAGERRRLDIKRRNID